MAAKSVKVWFDPEGDFLEVTFDSTKSGLFRQTADDRVMQRVDSDGNVIGFSILAVSTLATFVPVELDSWGEGTCCE